MKKIKKPITCLIMLCLLLTGCGKTSQKSNDYNSDIYAIYEKYLANGGELTYEQWLESIKGENGTSILTGHGIPSSLLGGDGDSYIDVDTWDFYTKNNGVWTKQGNIKGTDGKNGENGQDGKDGVTYIPAIFNNYDGTMLYTFYFEKGTTASYNGPTPTRPSDFDGEEELPYTFIGWDKSLENIQEPTIFTAQYRSKMYDVTFENYDGETLYSTRVERGHNAVYAGATPVRNDNPNLEWTFTGWDKPLENIKANTTFIAQFYAPNSIKCTFLNYNGEVLSTQYIGNGDNVNYEGALPVRDDDDNGEGTITSYEFIGWDNSLKNITQDTVFVAQYGSTLYYEVKFVDYNDTLLYKTKVIHGGTAYYLGEDPKRDDYVEGNTVTRYTFDGWDKSQSNVTGPIIVKAVYSSIIFTGYKVTFLDNDSTELYSYYFKEGTAAAYPYDNPFHYDSNNVYMFVGWSGSIENIVTTTTVTAQFKTISREQNGEYPQSVVTDESLIASLEKITTKNSRGYYEYGGEQYDRIQAKPYNLSSGSTRYTTFNDGSSISYNSYYYFKVEPIRWKLLEENSDYLMLISEYLLDCCGSYCPYDYGSWGSRTRTIDGNTIYGSDYKYSLVRAWLNGLDGTNYMVSNYTGGGFLNRAFGDDFFIQNASIAYNNETLFDKVFILNYNDLNSNYDFDSNNSRCCKTTDYARANGAYDDPYSHFGRYWTRSAYGSTYVYYVSSGGSLVGGTTGSEYTSYSFGRCVRPAINLKIL